MSNGIQINYKMTMPAHMQLSITPAQALQKKLCTVPLTSLDKLHPTEQTPFVEYVDDDIWKNRITFHKDLSRSVQTTPQLASHPDLDSLCESELKRRYPNYTIIHGLAASLKNKFPNLYRGCVGTKRFYQEFTQKEVKKYKKQIAYSACNRDDLKSSPKIIDPTLRKELHLTDDTLLQTDHIFAKNSPMNGQNFVLDGKTIHLTQAIACSSDRKVENTGNLRVVQTKDKESICYTGRADSDQKALEQASFLFLNELRTKGKGITKTTDSQGHPIYQFDYVANSLLSAPKIWSRESIISPFPEREYLENERLAFQRLQQNGPMTIEDPNCPGQKFKVQFNPILFSRSLNIFTRLEEWLPSFVTGMRFAQSISEQGWSQLSQIAEKKLHLMRGQLNTVLPSSQKEELENKIDRIQTLLKTLNEHAKNYHLRPEEELLSRDYLCKLLELPVIYHCKSSTDRTSIPNAMSQSLKQWIELKLPIPEKVTDLIQDYRFKELFAANWMAGHQITRYARGGLGTVSGEKLNDKNLGLVMSRGISQNPAITHLVPERYLTNFPTSEKLKISALYFLLLVPLTLIFYIPLVIINLGMHLVHFTKVDKKYLFTEVVKYIKTPLLLRLYFNFAHLFPDKVLNENSPQIRERRLIAGGKKGGIEDDK